MKTTIQHKLAAAIIAMLPAAFRSGWTETIQDRD
mgnify:CR=1 FL=1